MAGFFGFFDYSKPGKGVEKDAQEKHSFFLFFELVWRKLGRLMLLNLMYFVILLPLLTVVYILLYGYLFSTLQQADAGLLAQMGLNADEMMLPLLSGFLIGAAQNIPALLQAILLAASILLYGPASCGMAYMLRNFARQQHAWTSDFFDKMKQNFKQGLALGLLDIVLLSLLVFNIVWTAGAADGLMIAARIVSMALLLIYCLMRNYLFVMTVTFHLTIVQLLKNAWIFSVMGLWRNLLILVVNGALIALALSVPIVELFFIPVLLFAFTGFMAVFTCFPVVKKYLLDPQTAEAESE